MLVAGRPISARSVHLLRTNLLRMLDRGDEGAVDLRANVRRMAVMLEDLTRLRVLRLPDADFEEYLSLTVPFAATNPKPVPVRPPSAAGRLLQRGVLFAAATMRLRMEHRGASRLWLRVSTARLLAHFHRVAPPVGRTNLADLRSQQVDVNAAGIQPAVHHYLRASIESIDSGERSVVGTFAMAVSVLNAGCALAVMNARSRQRVLDGQEFRDALVEANDLAHIDPRGLPGRVLTQLAGGVEALYVFAGGA